MTIKSYNDIKVETIWSSPDPGVCIREALDNTMKNISGYFGGPLETVPINVLRFLFKAEHSSVVEHAVISFRVLGASRSWLAQITRHRMGSFTSSSQHYQDYTDYPFVVNANQLNSSKDLPYLQKAFGDSMRKYVFLQQQGVPKEEARQVLPNAMAVNLIWTVNARSLYNFMRLRMCLRNVAEIRIFSDKVLSLVQEWWPEYAEVLGPPCFVDGECNQGFMSCGKIYKR